MHERSLDLLRIRLLPVAVEIRRKTACILSVRGFVLHVWLRRARINSACHGLLHWKFMADYETAAQSEEAIVNVVRDIDGQILFALNLQICKPV